MHPKRQWLSIVAITFAGPAIALYIASDRLYTEPTAFRYLHNVPFGFYLAAVLSYTVAITFARTSIGLQRAILALATTFLLHTIGWTITWPIQFGLGDGPKATQEIGFVILALLIYSIAGFFYSLILRSGVPVHLEVAGHIVAMAGPLAILGLFRPEHQFHQFGSRYGLFAAIPFFAIVIGYADRRIGLRRTAFALLVSVSPIYMSKVWSDHVANRGNALLWPWRIADEFMTPTERNDHINKIISGRHGQPARIGEHWYSFGRAGIQNPHPNNAPRPDRIQSLQLAVPAEELDLSPSLGRGSGRIELKIGVPGKTTPRRPNDDLHVFAYYEDLVIFVVRQKKDASWPPDEDVERRLLKYIESRRVSPPPKSSDGNAR